MSILKLLIILIVECLFTEKPSLVDAAKILGVVGYPCHSQAILCRTLLLELASRGHEVTMISAFPLEENLQNYTDIGIDTEAMVKVREMTVVNASQYLMSKASVMFKASSICNDVLLSDKKVKALIASKEKFDLLISLNVGSVLGLGHAFNASTILFDSYSTNPYHTAFNKNPMPSSYVPNLMAPHSDEMSYFERILNTMMNLYCDFYITFIWTRTEDEILQKHFPGAPHVSHLHESIKLELHNSYMTLDNVRPFLSNAIQIGGFHLDAPEELPSDLKTFLDEGTNGVILFSLGTGMTAKIMGDKINILLKCFGLLPYQILWKNDGNVEGQPSNVKTMKWIPQRAVLGHPNVKLFIMHGGHGSVLESIYNAVPMIILPFLVDQHNTAAQSARDGYAISLDVETLTVKEFLAAINKIITSSSYYNEVALRADALRNQEVNPMQKAMYWIERVINHKNATYLKCTDQYVPLYKYYLFDICALTLFIIFMCIYSFSGIVKLINLVRMKV